MSEASAWPFPLDDPYPAYAAARRRAPVMWDAALDAWLVLSHRHARAVLSDPSFSADPAGSPRLFERLGGHDPGGALLSKVVLFTDPPEHDRLRRAVTGWFTPRQVRGLRERIADLVEEAWPPAADEPVDLMATVARPLPLAVIAELLDVGADAATVLADEATALTATLDPLAGVDERRRAAEAGLAVSMALIPVVAERRQRPGRDLTSALLDALQPDEVTIMALVLLAAGHVTTAELIGNAFRLLTAARLDQLRARPDLVSSAVEELLRWDPPAQLVSRVATTSCDLGTGRVEPGQQVLVVIGAANRDPAAYPHPDHLDLGRYAGPDRPPPSLAFGHGAHACLGAALARMEGTEIVRRPCRDGPWAIHAAERAPSASFRRLASLMATSPAASRSTPTPENPR